MRMYRFGRDAFQHGLDFGVLDRGRGVVSDGAQHRLALFIDVLLLQAGDNGVTHVIERPDPGSTTVVQPDNVPSKRGLHGFGDIAHRFQRKRRLRKGGIHPLARKPAEPA